MKKLTVLFFAFLLSSMALYAQVQVPNVGINKLDTTAIPKHWDVSGSASLNMTQSSYSNWASGGQNSIAGVIHGGLGLHYLKGKWKWDTSLDLAYGLMTQKESGRSKTEDKIELATKLSRKAARHWYYALLAQLKTQFDKGYSSYPVKKEHRWSYTSKFMAPGYLTLALGMDYNPNADFSLFLSPVAIRATYVQDKWLSDAGYYGVEPGKKSLIQYGTFVKAVYQKELIEGRVLLKSKLELFSDWEDKPQNIDVNWEVNVDFKATKWLSTRLYTQLIYDDNIRFLEQDGSIKGAKVQLKEVLGIGISYIF